MKIEETTLVAIPRSEAFRFAVQPENMPLWNPGVLESRVVGPLGKGASVIQLCRILGHRFETGFEVTCFQPPRRITFSSVDGPMEIRGTMEFTAARSGTRVRWIVEGDCAGFLHVSETVLKRVGHLRMRECLQALADLLADEAVVARR